MTARSSDDPAATRILRGLVAGAIAGIVASVVMEQFQAAIIALSSSEGDGEPATEQAADAVAESVAGKPLADRDKPLGGQALHYALGAGLGAAYAVAAEFRPAVTAGCGTAFGALNATLMDEAAVPAVGLADTPWKAPAGTHLYSYASHLVFGGATELIRRLVRKTLIPKETS